MFWLPYFTCICFESSGTTLLISFASRLSASASSTVRLTRWSVATPRTFICPAYTLSRLAPSALIRSSTAFCAPLPSATMVMTAPTPITMPSIVSAARSLLARIDWNATATVSPICMATVPPVPLAARHRPQGWWAASCPACRRPS